MQYFIEAEPLTYISRYEGDDINNYIKSLEDTTSIIPSTDGTLKYLFEF